MSPRVKFIAGSGLSCAAAVNIAGWAGVALVIGLLLIAVGIIEVFDS